MKGNRMFILMLLALLWVVPQQMRAQLQKDSVAFVPHWYAQPMVGFGIHIGENDLGNRISPAVQLSLGRQFSPAWGVRLSAVGWDARNALAWPDGGYYSWNYIQGTADVTLSLPGLFSGFNWDRCWDVYALLGGGVAVGWNNDDVKGLDAHYLGFDKQWDGTRAFLAARGGLGVSYRVHDYISLLLEGNISMLPDHFNSKVGKHRCSRDWQMNIMAGVQIALGKPIKKIARPVPPPPPPVIEPEPVKVPEPEPVAMADTEPMPVPEPMVVDVYYAINSVTITEPQRVKLDSLVTYLKLNPETKVVITGYADRQTGTAAYNLQISRRRADAVYRYLKQKGLGDDRMQVSAMGDKEQPRPTMLENRVVICVVEEKGSK